MHNSGLLNNNLNFHIGSCSSNLKVMDRDHRCVMNSMPNSADMRNGQQQQQQ
jgi:hypothetical protein